MKRHHVESVTGKYKHNNTFSGKNIHDSREQTKQMQLQRGNKKLLDTHIPHFSFKLYSKVIHSIL